MNKSLTPKDGPFLGLLRKWLEGDFRKTDEARLRDLLARDDFQREAFEGYAGFAEGDEKPALEALRSRLRTRAQAPEKVRPMPRKWLAAAASLAALAVAAMWAIDRFSDPKMSEKPVAQTAPVATQSVDNQAITSASDAVRPAPEAAAATAKRLEPQSPPSLLSEPKKPVDRAFSEPVAAADELVLEEKEAPKAAASPAEPAKKAESNRAFSDAKADDSEARQQAEKAASGPFIFYGKVTDEASGAPLVGASVALRGMKMGTTTDLDGAFQVGATSAAGAEIEVSYPGYLSEKVKIAGKNVRNIALAPDRDRLAEVVVTAQPKAKKRKDAREDAAGPAPKMGWPSFENFERTNLRMPEQAKKAGIKGEVTLEFFVDSKGQPTQIFIAQSLGYGCDEEAIRLLESSGEWSGLRKEASISIRFGE